MRGPRGRTGQPSPAHWLSPYSGTNRHNAYAISHSRGAGAAKSQSIRQRVGRRGKPCYAGRPRCGRSPAARGCPDLELPARAINASESGGRVVETPQQLRGPGQRPKIMQADGNMVRGHLALDEAEHFPALPVDPQEPRRPVEPGIGQMNQQGVDARAPRPGGTANRRPDSDHGRHRAATQDNPRFRGSPPASTRLVSHPGRRCQSPVCGLIFARATRKSSHRGGETTALQRATRRTAGHGDAEPGCPQARAHVANPQITRKSAATQRGNPGDGQAADVACPLVDEYGEARQAQGSAFGRLKAYSPGQPPDPRQLRSVIAAIVRVVPDRVIHG
jgi:hypothetical protein